MATYIAALTITLVTLAAGLVLAARRRKTTSDGRACRQGSCGDTMEIGLQFVAGRVRGTQRRSSGCGHSCMCVDAAARLAEGKTAPEVLRVDATQVTRCAGGTPGEHEDCARLAAETLHAAAKDYLRRREPPAGASSATAPFEGD